jgi:hypothetical protein
VANGLSSTYACQNCCGDSFDHGTCLPNVVIGPPGGTSQFSAQEYDHNCYGVVGAPFYVSVSSWSSDNTAVATINSSGLATAQDGGSTNIVARWAAYVRYLYGYPAYCRTDSIFPGASALCQVVIPKHLAPLDFPPRAPNGYGPLIVITDDQVLDMAGNPIPGKDHQCGVYRNLAYEATDQNGNPFNYPYVITETFTDYQGPASAPSPLSFSISSNAVGDTIYIGKRAPACLGPDEHESFKQHFSVRYNNKDYPLTTVVSISRGRYNGVYQVDAPFQ